MDLKKNKVKTVSHNKTQTIFTGFTTPLNGRVFVISSNLCIFAERSLHV